MYRCIYIYIIIYTYIIIYISLYDRSVYICIFHSLKQCNLTDSQWLRTDRSQVLTLSAPRRGSRSWLQGQVGLHSCQGWELVIIITCTSLSSSRWVSQIFLCLILNTCTTTIVWETTLSWFEGLKASPNLQTHSSLWHKRPWPSPKSPCIPGHRQPNRSCAKWDGWWLSNGNAPPHVGPGFINKSLTSQASCLQKHTFQICSNHAFINLHLIINTFRF